MKTLIVYDSVFGHTEKIAQSIAAALGTQAISVNQVTVEQTRGLDILIAGSPTRSLRPTEAMVKFLGRIPKASLQGVRTAAFDTRWALENIDSNFLRFVVGKGGYAARAIAQALEKKGGKSIAPPEGFLVTGDKGPLKDGELERAAAWARQIASKE